MSYYEIIFFILLLFQEELKGFIATFFCFLMTVANNFLAPYIFSQGYFTFYESMFAVDLLFFIISFYFIGYTIGWILMFTMFASIVFNTIPILHPTQEVYNFYQDYYFYVNIVLFEILVYTCITTTVVYPKVKKYLKERYNNDFRNTSFTSSRWYNRIL